MKTIAIIGRPNVGKSTLFNRIIGRRKAIVDDTPGVTRDWKADIAEVYGRKFRLIDTAGLEKAESKSLEELMMRQTDVAMDMADFIIFVVDGTSGIHHNDQFFAKKVRKLGKPVIIVANKCEKKAAAIDEFYRMGFGEPVAVSAEHKLGFADLYERIDEAAGKRKKGEDEDGEEDERKEIQIAIIGRPNAGKSTILNKILKQDRVIASPMAGTTRDAIEIDWEYKGEKLKLIDTAGMRKRANVIDKLEKYSVSDSVNAINFAHVVVLVIDATEPVSDQDLKIASLVIREGRALVVVVNKWDLVEDKRKMDDELKYLIRKHMSDVVGVPVVKTSALNDKSLDRLLDAALDIYKVWNTRVSTSRLNNWLSYLLEHHPPPMSKAKRIKIRYITQTKSRPPTFMLSCSQPENLPDSYVKYMINDMRGKFGLQGVPIRMHLPKKSNPYLKE